MACSHHVGSSPASRSPPSDRPARARRAPDRLVRRGRAACGALRRRQGAGGPLLGRLVDRRGQTVVLLGSALVAGRGPGHRGRAARRHAACRCCWPLAALIGFATPPVGACMRTLIPLLRPGARSAAPGVRGGRRRHRADLGIRAAAGPRRRRRRRLRRGAHRGRRRAGHRHRGCSPSPPRPAAGAEPVATGPGQRAAPRRPCARWCSCWSAWACCSAPPRSPSPRRGPGGAGLLLGLWGVGSLAGGVVAARLGGGARTAAASRCCWPPGLGHLILVAASASRDRLGAC